MSFFMRLLLLTTVVLASIHVSASSFCAADTTDPNMFRKGTSSAKMLAARHEFLNNNMRGALTLYREVLDTDPNNAQALYRVAECHYNLKSYPLAVEYFDKAMKIDPNVSESKDYFRALIHHRVAELDEAIEAYGTFIKNSKSSKTLEYELAVEGMEQCKYAKQQMARPHNVKATNLGRSINSRYDDYTPSVSADGKLLVFTSRRGDVSGGESTVDRGSDYKFFEDVFFSEWDQEAGEWSKAFPVEGKINTPFYDAVLSLAPDGKSMYVYRNNAQSAGNIFMSERDEKGEWSEPVKLNKPVNSSYFESSISTTADGNTIYFISERPGGRGQADIYTAKKTGLNMYSAPVNLGDVINTPFDEKFVFIHPNGKSIYFASDGHQTMGSYDIFRSDLINGQWAIPLNLGYPINTVNEESTFSLTADNKTFLLAAEYEDSYGERDIYTFDVSNHPIINPGNHAMWTEVEITIKEGGKGKKAAPVIIFSEHDKVVYSGKTNDRGRLTIHLPDNSTYLIRTSEKAKSEEKKFELPKNGPEMPQVKVELKM
jgi:tetratricopeptide (TPR) repeat protein